MISLHQIRMQMKKNTLTVNDNMYEKLALVLPFLSTADQVMIKSVGNGNWLSMIAVDVLSVLFQNESVCYFPLQIRDNANIMKLQKDNSHVDTVLTKAWEMMSDHSSVNYWFFPMYVGRNHFVSIIYDLRKDRLFYIDSMNSQFYQYYAQMQWESLIYESPHYDRLNGLRLTNISSNGIQRDSNNCGVFVIIFMDIIGNGVDVKMLPSLDYSVIDFSDLRKKFSELLKNFTKKEFRQRGIKYDLFLR